MRPGTALLAALVVCSAALPVRAQDPRVLAIASPVVPDVLERIRGQTSDLDWEIALVEVGPEGTVVERASRAAASARATVSLAVEGSEEGFALAVVDVASGRVEVRHVARARGPRSRSALVEAASLVVRSVLVHHAPSIAANTNASAAVAPEPEPATIVIEPPPPPARPLRVEGFVAAGAGFVVDGHSPLAQLGARVRGGVRLDWLELGMDAHLGPGETLAHEGFDLFVSRLDVHAFVGALAEATPDFFLGATLGIGASGVRRETHLHDDALIATEPALLVSPSLAIDGRMRLGLHELVAIELSLGAALLASPPELVLQIDADLVRLHSLWVLQPRAALSVCLRFH